MNIATLIRQLEGVECWSVVGGSGPGSVISLGFGEKTAREIPSKNKHLTQVERLYDPEFGLIVYCAWRILCQGSIIGGWRDCGPGTPLRRQLDRLVGLEVRTVDVNPKTYDLSIKFQGDLGMDVFCDITSYDEDDDNYVFFDGQWTETLGYKWVGAIGYKSVPLIGRE